LCRQLNQMHEWLPLINMGLWLKAEKAARSF